MAYSISYVFTIQLMTYTPFTPKLTHVLGLFCSTRFKFFFLVEAVDFKCSTLKIQVSDYLNLMEKFTFSVLNLIFRQLNPVKLSIFS